MSGKMGLTRVQADALAWLENHGGFGVMCKRLRKYDIVGMNRTLLAGGEKAGWDWSIWEALEVLGLVKFDATRKRIELTRPSQAGK